ncbi:hypothetical protein [Sulfobacillus thermosulfidooxidans]|nr:hypothetical protein [Sulfobacillus thermosulfidooxidans]
MKPPQGLAGAHHIASAGRMSALFADTRDCIAIIRSQSERCRT